ncbi:hypothetical protein K469DRAFT_602343, partial [Zopfia rhizophila CBS 207.26]
DTSYAYMHYKLGMWWKQRPTDLTHEERWKVRGIKILLGLALELCSSYPAYDILRDGNKDRNEGAFLIGLLSRPSCPVRYMVAKGIAIMAARTLTHLNPSASYMPASPYQSGAVKTTLPPRTHLWAALITALTDRRKTAHILEGLLQLVSLEMDVPKYLIQIGDPGKVFEKGEDDILRAKLRTTLFPEYDKL